jgi:NAD(P)H-hydrate epimerase
MPALTRTQVRNVDRVAMEEFGFTGLVLMENAGRGCVDLLCTRQPSGLIAILCGKGNNGGDGYVIARHLAIRGHQVLIVMLAAPESLQGDALANYQVAVECGLPIICYEETAAEAGSDRGADDGIATWLDHHCAAAEWLVDAMLGTGTAGAPRPPLDAVIRWSNSRDCRRFAIDLPSGLDCDTGQAADPTFRADTTATFVARKIGFENPAAAPYLGDVAVLDIGVPANVVHRALEN